jgi:hypothetical protein
VGSNPTRGMDVGYMCAFFCVYVVLYLGRGLVTGWSLAVCSSSSLHEPGPPLPGAITLCGSWPLPCFHNSQTPNMEDHGLLFVWPLLFDPSGMVGPTRRLRSRQHSFVIGACKLPLHDKA